MIAALLMLTACSDGEDSEAPADPPSSEAPVSAAAEEPADAPVATPELDSIAVIGHSGATGTMSDPDDLITNAYENSWATGENPEVRSIYHRLLATRGR